MNTISSENNSSKKDKKGRSFFGKVVSNKMHKTLGVLVERKVKHPILGKYLLRSKKYSVHYETGDFNLGDTISIRECKPVSKTKAWEVTGTVAKATES